MFSMPNILCECTIFDPVWSIKFCANFNNNFLLELSAVGVTEYFYKLSAMINYCPDNNVAWEHKSCGNTMLCITMAMRHRPDSRKLHSMQLQIQVY